MQREVSKAAIRAGRRNNLSEFFAKIREITKYKDQHGVPSDHVEHLKELCARIKNSSALNGEEICQIAMLTAYLFQNLEEANKLIGKAQQKEPNNEFIFREAVFLAHYDNKEDEAKAMFDQRKKSLKDRTIRDDLEKFFKIKAECNAVRDDIIHLLGEEKWVQADAKIVAAIRATGGLNPYNLELYRMRMDSLGEQPNNEKNVAEFYMNLATQNPGSNSYYQYAGSAFLQANLYDQAIVAYTNYFKHECNDIEELDKFLSIADKKTQIDTLEGLLSNKIAQSDQKQDIIKKITIVGGNTSLGISDSDEEDLNKREEQNILNVQAEITAAPSSHGQVSQKAQDKQTEHSQQLKGIKTEKNNFSKGLPAGNAEINQKKEQQQNLTLQGGKPIQKTEGIPQVHIEASNSITVEIQQDQPAEAQQFISQNKQQKISKEGTDFAPNVIQRQNECCCTIF